MEHKSTDKEQNNIRLNTSDHYDITEIELSTDSESNLNSENQCEAEDANDSLKIINDTSEYEAKESERETSKGQEKAQNVAEGGGSTSSKATEYTEKNQQKQKFQNKKKSNRNLVVKQKVLKNRLIVMPRHQKWLQGLAVD